MVRVLLPPNAKGHGQCHQHPATAILRVASGLPRASRCPHTPKYETLLPFARWRSFCADLTSWSRFMLSLLLNDGVVVVVVGCCCCWQYLAGMHESGMTVNPILILSRPFVLFFLFPFCSFRQQSVLVRFSQNLHSNPLNYRTTKTHTHRHTYIQKHTKMANWNQQLLRSSMPC